MGRLCGENQHCELLFPITQLKAGFAGGVFYTYKAQKNAPGASWGVLERRKSICQKDV